VIMGAAGLVVTGVNFEMFKCLGAFYFGNILWETLIWAGSKLLFSNNSFLGSDADLFCSLLPRQKLSLKTSYRRMLPACTQAFVSAPCGRLDGHSRSSWE
jgi:hypothetical protein